MNDWAMTSCLHHCCPVVAYEIPQTADFGSPSDPLCLHLDTPPVVSLVTEMSRGALLMRSLCDLDTVAHVLRLCLALRFGRLFSVHPFNCFVNRWRINGALVEH